MKEHTGHITKIEDNTVTVKILQLSACASCDAGKYCTLAESKEKEIKIPVTDPNIYNTGEEVEIIVKKKQLYTAVLWAYVLPLIILFIGVGLGSIFNLTEAHSAIIAVCGVALYYGFLYGFNKFLSKKLEFKIRKLK